MASNYFDPNSEEAPVASDSQSSDQSKSGLRKAWDAWTSRPENNAALLQFGIAMLQPRSPGQTALGQAANAVGAGAEASGRVQATEEALQTEEAKREELASLGEARKASSQAALQNAAAYAKSVEQYGGGKGLTPIMRAQATLRNWAVKPEDPLAIQMNNGVSTDNLVQSLARKHPEVKQKSDITSNPALMREALAILAMQEQAIEPDTTTAPPASAQPGAAASAPPPAPIRRYNSQGKAVEWNGTAWIPVPQ
jgi:hypothetical protein